MSSKQKNKPLNLVPKKVESLQWRLKDFSDFPKHGIARFAEVAKEDPMVLHFGEHKRHALKISTITRTKRKQTFIINRTNALYNLPKWEVERQKLSQLSEELEKCFKDVVQRQIVFFELKYSIEELSKVVGLENRGFLRVLTMTHDALSNVKSERLKKSQVEDLKFVLQRLNENTDDFTATELEGILIDSNLKPTPKIEGIADLFS